jgi:hypothetical protein
VRRLAPPLILGIVVFLALSLGRWLLRPAPTVVPPQPVTLSVRDLLGCWELDSGEWVFESARPQGSSGAESPADSASRALLVLPDRLLLLPDSIDEWQRQYTTYRAAPMEGDHDPALRDYLRWFPRADTLWLVWSDRRMRAGLALLAGDGIFEGAGRALIAPADGSSQPVDGRVSAAAWKVNCASGLRDVPRSAPRR